MFLLSLLGRLSLGCDLPTSNEKIFLCQSIHLYQLSRYYSSASILSLSFKVYSPSAKKKKKNVWLLSIKIATNLLTREGRCTTLYKWPLDVINISLKLNATNVIFCLCVFDTPWTRWLAKLQRLPNYNVVFQFGKIQSEYWESSQNRLLFPFKIETCLGEQFILRWRFCSSAGNECKIGWKWSLELSRKFIFAI